MSFKALHVMEIFWLLQHNFPSQFEYINIFEIPFAASAAAALYNVNSSSNGEVVSIDFPSGMLVLHLRLKFT